MWLERDKKSAAAPSVVGFQFSYLGRPGRRLDDAAADALCAELIEVGRTCLSPLPHYQVFVGGRACLSDKVLMLARDASGRLVGFTSAVVLEVAGVGPVLHLGLTCVRPEARGARLTHLLVSKLVTRFYATRRAFRRLWVTNVACVLSSLGSVAKNFAQVHPSPWSPQALRPEVWLIARAFDERYREVAHIQPSATFDPDTFVFRGSGRGTAFQKEGADDTFAHRESKLNDFYRNILNFDDGDEVLQVGAVEPMDIARYFRGGRGKGVRTW